MAGPKQRKKLKPRRKIPEMEFGGAKVGVYMKPLDTKSKKGKGPSRSQQRAGEAQKLVRKKIKSSPGLRVTTQMKKDLTKRAREHIIEKYKKKYPKAHVEDLIRKYGFGTDKYKGKKS